MFISHECLGWLRTSGRRPSVVWWLLGTLSAGTLTAQGDQGRAARPADTANANTGNTGSGFASSVMFGGAILSQLQAQEDEARAHRDQIIAAARLRITPSEVTFSGRTAQATVQITNPLDTTVVIDWSLRFTYPQVNAVGVLIPDSLGATAMATAHDLTRWVHGLPGALTLAPHATRTLTLTLAAPPGLPAGEFWTTLVAIARHVALRYHDTPFRPRDIVTTIPLVYREQVPPGVFVVQPPQVTVVGDSLARVCVPLQPRGRAHAIGQVHIAFQTGVPGGDTAFTYPVAVYVPIAPCVTFPVRTLPPGAYPLAVTVRDARQDLASGAEPAAHLVVPVVISVNARQAAQQAVAQAAAHRDSLYTSVTLDSAQGPLPAQLAAAAQRAQELGRTPVLEIGATWCAPCHELEHLLQSPTMETGLQGIYLIHLDADQWVNALVLLGIKGDGVPVMVTMDHTARLTTQYFQGDFTVADLTTYFAAAKVAWRTK